MRMKNYALTVQLVAHINGCALLSLTQTNLYRMLAYNDSIAHINHQSSTG